MSKMSQHFVIKRSISLIALIASVLSGLSAAVSMPASVVQAEGLDAIFLCQHPTDSGTIDWTINGTALRNIDTSNGLIRSEGRGAAVEALIIAAIPEYNNTVVVCLKFIRINESVILETSPPAVLMVQGVLGAVFNLKRATAPDLSNSSITLMWERPYSLNLTTSEPDIIYCVDVYDATGGQEETAGLNAHLISDCTVLEESFTFKIDNPDPNTLFRFVVIPRSNVQGAKNGTATSILEHISYELPKSVPNVNVLVGISADVDVSVEMVLNASLAISGPRRPEAYRVSVNLINTDNPSKENISNCSNIDENDGTENVSLTLNCDIDLQQLCTFNISASNEAGESLIFTDGKLSTHFIQDINTSSNTPGQINITCKFLANSDTASGFLAIVHSNENYSDTYYLITPNNDQSLVPGSLSNVRKGTYTIILFTIGKDGLPLRRAAGFPQTLSVPTEGGEAHTGSSGFLSSITIHKNCTFSVACSFNDHTTSACVAVYWQNISNPYGLVNLVATKLERYGSQNTTHALVELQGVRSEGYHIAVFVFNSKKNMIEGEPVVISYTVCEQDQQSSEQSVDVKKILIIIIPTVTVTIISLGIMVIIIIIVIFKKCSCKLNRSTNKKKVKASDSRFALVADAADNEVTVTDCEVVTDHEGLPSATSL